MMVGNQLYTEPSELERRATVPWQRSIELSRMRQLDLWLICFIPK